MKMNVEKKKNEEVKFDMKSVKVKESDVMNVKSVEMKKIEEKKKVEKLNSDVVRLLESNDIKFVDIKEKSGRRKIVNWIEVLDFCIENKWVNMNMISEYVLSNYNKEKIYYSELLRFIRSDDVNKKVIINKKVIDSGEDKNVYYSFVKRK